MHKNTMTYSPIYVTFCSQKGMNPFKRGSKKDERSENTKQENFNPLSQSKEDEFDHSQPHNN